ncbi:hypothetical protein [Actinoplanes derwentensis]|uniref:PknH-like extracellular domain-containing protein n=1 Tax=Actinoplanes derwentensis TaxID=113562 RepID=A0A1H1QN31_9ACTN|nr:hypothetical protein [Actinoplanes derwentensis]GID82091.1 hypothetical protein Ade03nite_10150 [Actinoplanes derwentensis]SDS24881.1 hypothetical protein SAMN04489716_0352 [Actinoplanes derwentensis]
MTRFLALTASLTLSTVLALPAAGYATVHPGPAAARTVAPDPADKLTAALLTGPELPTGYAPQLDAIDDLFARIPGEIASCGKTAALPAGTVFREFVRGAKDEELLVETLSEPGGAGTRAAVTALREAQRNCASFTRKPGELPMELRFAVSKSAAGPKIGEASAVVGFVMTVPSMELTVNGRLISVAAGGTQVTMLLMTEKKPKAADLTAAARAAVTKVLSR